MDLWPSFKLTTSLLASVLLEKMHTIKSQKVLLFVILKCKNYSSALKWHKNSICQFLRTCDILMLYLWTCVILTAQVLK